MILQRPARFIALWCALLAACSPEPALPTETLGATEVVDAEAIFHQLEATLVAADTVLFECSITAEGVVSSDLAGSLWLASGNRARIGVAGTFASEAVELTLLSDGTRLDGGSGAATFDIETPIGLREAILIGAMRMGLLHNLAMLTGGAPPDGADGSVREWVQVSGFATGDVAVIEGAEARPIRFQLTVAGRPSGEAELWIDTKSGLPVRRNQTVRFDSGDMRVVETYLRVELDGNPPPETFTRAGPDE